MIWNETAIAQEGGNMDKDVRFQSLSSFGNFDPCDFG